MQTAHLKYGTESIAASYDEGDWIVCDGPVYEQRLSDADIARKLDTPIDSLPLDDLVSPSDSILIVVPDATRQTAAGQIVNLVVRRLIANGNAPHQIRIIFATGIHRAVTESEKASILTPFIAQRISTLDHHPRDLMQIVDLGPTSAGIPVELNRALIEHDKVILVGGVSFHYFAGFTGGRKLVCPGLASSRTISATHKLAFDCERLNRRDGVGTGRLNGNPVHAAFAEITARIDPAFCITSIVDEDGHATDLFCGSWVGSHAQAADHYADGHTVELNEKRDVVIASCGGDPYDINIIQAHKALESAASSCVEGGMILLLAKCPDGLGRADMLKWFDSENSHHLAERLCKNYQVNGQTAWSLLTKAERFRIKVITDLDGGTTQKMRLDKVDTAFINEVCRSGAKGYILPNAARCRVVIKT